MFQKQAFSGVWRAGWVLLLVVFLSACLSNNDSPSDVSPRASTPGAPSQAQGYVVKGPVAGSVVNVFALNENGSRGVKVAGPFVTDSRGFWRGSVPFSDEPYEVVSTGGTYVDEASGLEVRRSSGDDSLSGVLDLEESAMAVISPYTSAVLLAAKHRVVRDNVRISAALRSALFDIKQAFGFDVASVVPDFGGGNAVSDASDEQMYAALLGGFSTLMHNNPALTAFNALPEYKVRDALIEDFVDGRFDGKGITGNPVKVALSNGQLMDFSVLSDEGLSALISASNAYASSQEGLAHVMLDTQLVLAFNSEGGRLLGSGVDVSVTGEGYFMFDTGTEFVYKREATLKLNEESIIVDGESGHYLMVYLAESNGLPTTVVRHLPIYARDYLLHTIAMNSKGIIRARRIASGVDRFLGHIVLATFANSDALSEVSPGLWQETPGSGAASLVTPGKGMAGSISLLQRDDRS